MKNGIVNLKKIFFLFISILLWLGLSSIVAAQDCTDSDGGEDYYARGYIIMNNNGLKDFDYCGSIGSGILVEKVCDDWQQYKTYICPNECIDGACIPGDEKEIDQESLSIKTIKSAYNADEILTGRDSSNSDNIIRLRTNFPVRMNRMYCNYSYASFNGEELSTGSGGCQIDEESFGGNPSRIGVGEWRVKIIAWDPNTEKTFTLLSPPFIIYSESACTDTDSGQNYYVKGLTIDNKGGKASDNCKTSDYLQETYCEPDNSIGRFEYKCPEGCEDDACLPFYGGDEAIQVTEEDEEEIESSEECPEKSCETVSEECIGENKIIVEECNIYIKPFGSEACNEIKTTNSRILRDACTLDEKIPKRILCQGCQIDESTCIPFGTRLERKDVAYYCDIGKEMTNQKENGKQCQNSYECTSNNCKDSICSPICSGCFDENNNCLPYGTRTKAEFCNIDGKLAGQKNEERSCNNNYECSSNVCINNECISQNFIQKIMNWFRKLFG